MASIATFAQEVGAINVSGVTRRYLYPPKQVSTADLPASWIRPPTNTNSTIATCDSVNDTFAIQLVIATDAANQDNQRPNYDEILAMMDNTNDALKNASFTNIRNDFSWSLSAQDTQPIILDTTAYWGVVATITAQGAN